MISKIFILFFTFFFLFIATVVGTELPVSPVGLITLTKTAVAQPSDAQIFHTTPPNYEFNSLPGDPDPAQVKIVYSTTIKHAGNKSKPTDSTSANANATNMINAALIVACIVAAMFWASS